MTPAALKLTRAGFLCLLALLLVMIVYLSRLQPSNERDWLEPVARLPYATVDGDKITMHNIRHFQYRSETDYTPAYEEKQFDLRQLEAIDVIASYWMGPHIAHVFLSFAFANGEHLAVSIETRTEKGEGYSTFKGFFRQYELFYVVADERDVVRLRTQYRQAPPEDVYIYRAQSTAEGRRRLFLEYVSRINALKAQPEFYNSLTTNCTTSIWQMSSLNSARLPFSWKILASGHVPEFLYENGRLETRGLSFPELQQQAHINSRAQTAGDAPDFSQQIRTVKK